jgi:hypothetical protein
MKLELQRELIERYPRFFRRPDDQPGPIDEDGIGCGDGWFALIEAVAAHAEAEIRLRVREGVPPRYWPRAVQVKEKFGALRVYLRGGISDALAEHRRIVCDELSPTICEECGRSGRLRGGGYWRTRCDVCEGRSEFAARDPGIQDGGAVRLQERAEFGVLLAARSAWL